MITIIPDQDQSITAHDLTGDPAVSEVVVEDLVKLAVTAASGE